MYISKEQTEVMLRLAGEKKAREAMERVWADLTSVERVEVLSEADRHPERFVAAELAFFQGKREQSQRAQEPEPMDVDRLLTEMIEAMETPASVRERRERTWAGMTKEERQELLNFAERRPGKFTDGEHAFFASKSVDEPTVPREDRAPERAYTFQEELDVLIKADPVVLLLLLLGAYSKRPVFGVDVHAASPAHPEQVRALLSDEAWDLAMSKTQAALRKNMNA